MPEPLSVLSVLPLSAAAQARIRAVDPRIRLHVLSDAARRRYRDPERPMAEASEADREVAEALGRSEVLLTLASQYRRLPDHTPVRWLHLASAGVDLALREGVPAPILVTNSRGLHAGPMGEWVLACLLLHAKRLPAFLAQQRTHTWQRQEVSLLQGATVGVVGLGAIGGEVARLSQAFGARVLATRRSARAGDSAPHVDQVLPAAELRSLLAGSDFVVLCLPLTEETRGLLGAGEFAAMKAGAALVNIARGEIVDWAAMLAGLRAGRPAAVYTDVTVPEPLPAADPAWDTPNLFITPHNSGMFPDYNDRAAEIFAAELGRYVRGEALLHTVDRTAGY